MVPNMSAIQGHKRIISGLVLAAVAVGALAATTIGANRTPTKGPIPDAAVKAGGDFDMRLVPDFVPALDRNGDVAGYVTKEALSGPPNVNIPVFAPDLSTRVGDMVPGKGFVPLGAAPDSVSDMPVVVAPGP